MRPLDRTTHHLVVGVLLWMTALAAIAASQTYEDRARVIEVQPVFATMPVSRRIQHCSTTPTQTSLGGAGAGLGQAIRDHQRMHAQDSAACRQRGGNGTHRSVVAYRVTYRYAGKTYIKETLDHPGDEIPVRVKLTPAP